MPINTGCMTNVLPTISQYLPSFRPSASRRTVVLEKKVPKDGRGALASTDHDKVQVILLAYDTV